MGAKVLHGGDLSEFEQSDWELAESHGAFVV